VYQIQGILGRVMLPLLAARQESVPDVRHTYLRACGAIALLMFPLMAGLAVTANDFVVTVYGAKWVSAIPIVRILAIVGMGSSVATTVGWLYTSMGRTDLMFKWAVLASPISLASFAIGVRWGALGVAVACAVCFYGVFWYPMWRLAGSVADLSFPTAMRALSGPFAASAVMVAIVLSTQMLFHGKPPTRLFLSVCVGVGTYWAAVRTLRIGSYLDVRDLLVRAIAGP
jgi:O-antigen/teichoic acid export membrane protein